MNTISINGWALFGILALAVLAGAGLHALATKAARVIAATVPAAGAHAADPGDRGDRGERGRFFDDTAGYSRADLDDRLDRGRREAIADVPLDRPRIVPPYAPAAEVGPAAGYDPGWPAR